MMQKLTIVLAFLLLNVVNSTYIPRAAPGTQFITGPCQSDADCASECCGFNSGKCAGPVIAQERDGGCGFGDPTPNNNAAQAVQGPNAEAAAGVKDGAASSSSAPAANNDASGGAAGATSVATSPAPAGTQFITGTCTSDADCASGCCGFNSGKCAGPVIAQERDGGCGFGDPTPNNNAAQAIQGSGAEAAPGVNNGASGGAAGASASSAAAPSTSSAASSGSASSSSGDFKLQNGKDAQALNAKFATLTADSSCDAGENACVDGGFAQCVGGKFSVTQCAGGASCFALPLVNSAGTSITCATESDAEARIAATGATGGLTGDGSAASGSSSDSSSSGSTPTSSSSNAASSPATNNAATSSGSGDFKLQNGKDAQQLNAQFASLSADSSCNAGENACVDGGFAQCVGGSFVVTPCNGGLTCAALPLVNSPGTSITCTTTADAEARIAASGATGGLTGSS